ncbi:C4-dicarboxylic acid transporter DauA [Microbulbifer thermotolerans]|uniref:C4-dicarboxylic acid transporter DauA n=1 Tax=Microbulbifer thermotolerans TaxID=252514 RepID=UPI0008EFF99A|nr:C4-dicarboxylic acid transporter DauA [Microbulbifer thermotolerans]MCX2780803.1 C4-dicarboxylic acid transporter DauA [Microbulbifer thermotolerans]MCX2794429.1 C4-dicarboxylic acid transporter DauA [Microbulbifer thermotolerans]MCX2804768.1 C4-dicarboxylic acid transporter DauA [Microbulbifer thermotolerans]SFC55706.1 sulfate permease, SulP family [Microbulbifer thermotolerans]
MAHRKHLLSLRVAHALRDALGEHSYDRRTFAKDLIAGVTVGIIAIPLAMALAIACGVAPQYGLYSAFVAGFLIPLLGGSRYSVSGPTAAFVVILAPVVQQYGLAGLLIASVLAGAMQLLLALMRLGRYIEYIPESVTLGFTGGIAVVIATLQLKDFMGLPVAEMPEHFTGKMLTLMEAMPAFSSPSLTVGLATLAVMLVWPRLKTPLPPHLPAVLVGTMVALALNRMGQDVPTVGSTFSYSLADGISGAGIPPVLPDFQWPWVRTQPGETPLVFSWQLAGDLLSAAFAIAMLGAIESLLCAVVLDGMTGKKHSANSELLGQGIGNMVTPFFGGITATAAIARSAANVKAGAQTPIAAMIHALVVLVALVSLSRLLGHLPMASMAALLMVVAWNMSEAPKAVQLIKKAPRSDVLVFAVCFSLTVLFDMVIAITAGVVLASLLFMKNMAEMTRVAEVTGNRKLVDVDVPEGWRVFKINGPLFFAAADRVFGELSLQCERQRGIVVYLDAVPILDAGGLSALTNFLGKCAASDTRVYLADFQYQPLKTLAKAGFKPDQWGCTLFPTLADALSRVADSAGRIDSSVRESGN